MIRTMRLISLENMAALALVLSSCGGTMTSGIAADNKADDSKHFQLHSEKWCQFIFRVMETGINELTRIFLRTDAPLG